MAVAFGSCLGAAISYAFSAKILSRKSITSFYTEFHVMTVLVPIAVICIGFFVFAYLASRKIRQVEVRELVQSL